LDHPVERFALGEYIQNRIPVGVRVTIELVRAVFLYLPCVAKESKFLDIEERPVTPTTLIFARVEFSVGRKLGSALVTTFEGLDWWELTKLQSLAGDLTEVGLSTYISCDNHLYATKRCSAVSSTLHHVVEAFEEVALHHADFINDKNISLCEPLPLSVHLIFHLLQ